MKKCYQSVLIVSRAMYISSAYLQKITMTIIDKLAEFNFPSKKCEQCIPFHTIAGNFDVISARSHFELLHSQKMHATNILEAVSQMRSSETNFDGIAEDDIDDETARGDHEGDKDCTSLSTESTTLENVKWHFEVHDKPFREKYNSVSQKLMNATATSSEESYIIAVRNETNRNMALAKDHLERCLLHVAVEQNHRNFVKFLVDLGLNVNSREGCGMTPLSIAVLQKSNALCRFLSESGTQYAGLYLQVYLHHL